MPRYRLLIEYDGSPFSGWQRQSDLPSVQGAIEQAIAAFSGEAPSLFGAGRTDAGVHALGQVAHFDVAKPWEPSRVRDAINFHLKPKPASILDCAEVPATFDARFSAIKRHYLYRILIRRAPAVLDRDRVWRVAKTLDLEAMAAAAQTLVGRHDFTTFRAAQCQAASPVKTLDAFVVSRSGDEIHCRVAARSFLHSQVRSMVGSLKLVGEGKWSIEALAAALAARDRTACGPIAPAAGLYLAVVDYPPGAF
ncbi:MAG: tRNA pseudouridine(38-40) synthase TruA [Hyphomicrobium sp.]